MCRDSKPSFNYFRPFGKEKNCLPFNQRVRRYGVFWDERFRGNDVRHSDFSERCFCYSPEGSQEWIIMFHVLVNHSHSYFGRRGKLKYALKGIEVYRYGIAVIKLKESVLF